MKEKITISKTATIKQAMKLLNKTGENCLLIVDEKNKLLGTLTDGDLRRSILKGVDYNSGIEGSCNRNPFYLVDGNFSKKEASKIMTKNKIDLIPIVDDSKKVLNYLTWEALFRKNANDEDKILSKVPVVIMAGGRGTRMEPFTSILPKPLVPVHGRPIIEHIIDRFTNLGCNNFYSTVNYKGKILKAYFEELNPSYNFYFIDEKEPLGTAGSLRYLDDKFESPFFVTNCDIIIEANYLKLYKFHKKEKCDVTVVASAKEYVIPYGTCELDKSGYLSHINEKPKYDFLINTGFYILNPSVLKLIPKNKFYHITHLIEEIKNQGLKVGVFPIDDDAWIDVGQWTEYRKALAKL